MRNYLDSKMPVNLVQYRGTVGAFNNRKFTKKLQYKEISKLKFIHTCFIADHLSLRNTISHLEFMSYIKLRLRWNLSYINQKLRPIYQIALNLCLTYIENFGKKCTRNSGATGNWQLAEITDTERGINIFQFFFVY